MALAKKLGFEDYAQPAGGCCFLTDEAYSHKLADLWKARGNKQYEMDDIMLLKVGRHIRPEPGYKLIISREEGEGKFLQGYRKQYPSLKTTSHPGPLALIDGDYTEEQIEQAARIVARYSKGKMADEVAVEYQDRKGVLHELKVKPMSPEEMEQEWMV